MRNLLISVAVAVSALAVASQASAQYFPQPQGNVYGYNNYGQGRGLEVRIDNVQRRIDRMAQRRMIGGYQARQLQNEARSLEYRLRSASSYGLNPGERYDIERRLARLELNVRGASGNRWGNGYNQYGYNQYGQNGGQYGYRDADRDGRDDGNEHARWHGEHDGNNHDDD